MKKFFGGGGTGGGSGMIAKLVAGAQGDGEMTPEEKKRAELEAKAKPMKKGGSVSASKRADGIAKKGKTKGKMV